jgi:GTP-binding protein Era
VAIIGRLNVGKSTLLNKILGQKISITSRKAQTTRHKILGIKTEKNVQAIYIDTPGFYRGKKHKLTKYMMQAIKSALADVDVIIFVLEGLIWKEEDEMLLENMIKTNHPIILVINKVDQIKDKDKLLPYVEELNKKFNFTAMIPLSAKTGLNISELEQVVAELLPENPFYFAAEQITDKSERFLVTEIIREKLTRLLGQEVPHKLTVEIEKFDEQEKMTHIAAVIYVERPGQKVIIIGKGGAKLKEIGTKARVENSCNTLWP